MRGIYAGYVAAGLLLTGCLGEAPIDPGSAEAQPGSGAEAPSRVWTPEENEALLAKVMDRGFARESIADSGAFFLAEDCIMFDKQDLLAESAPPALAKTAHWRSQYVVRDDKAHVLTVRQTATFNNGGGVNEAAQLVQAAIARWNELGYFVKLSYTAGTSADILVRSIPGPSQTCRSNFPTSSGLPGNLLECYLNPYIRFEAKVQELVHAIGHNIGLHHTNHTVQNPKPHNGVSPYAFIPSTPVSEPYPGIVGPWGSYSVMNNDIYFEDPFNGFSFGDGQAMRRLYSSHIKATANNPHRYAVDVNGDSKADLVTFDEDGVVVALAYITGSGFLNETLYNNQFGSRAAAGGWSDVNHVRALADVNGDGKTDVVGFGQAAVYVALSNGYSFVPLPSAAITNFSYNHGWRTDRHIRLVGDVTGDGRADIVAFGENDVLVATGRADGYFNAATIWNSDFGFADGWNLVKDYPRQLADVTGDGKADIVCFGHNATIVGVSTGSSFAAAIWASGANATVYSQGWRDANHIRTFGDVNGDGRKDLVAFSENDAIIALSTGSSFQNYLGSSLFGRLDGYEKSKTIRQVADVTGDGRADVVAVGLNEVLVGVSQGTSFSVSTWHTDFAENDGWRVANHLRTVADATGDGKADFIALGSNEGIMCRSTGSGFSPELWY